MQGVIDWKLATTVAEGIAGLKPAPDSTRFEHVAGPAEESARLVDRRAEGSLDGVPRPSRRGGGCDRP